MAEFTPKLPQIGSRWTMKLGTWSPGGDGIYQVTGFSNGDQHGMSPLSKYVDTINENSPTYYSGYHVLIEDWHEMMDPYKE